MLSSMLFCCKQYWMLDTFQGREGSVLNLSDTLVIRSLFLLLILLVAMTEGSVSMTLREGAEYPYEKMGGSDLFPRNCLLQHPGVLHPHYLLFWVWAVLLRVVGAVVQYQHCGKLQWEIRPLSSLWRIEGNPPRLQISECSTVNWWPQMQWDGRWDGHQP